MVRPRDEKSACSRQGPDSDLLRTFLAVAEQGNVTRAASRIARTQSGVSIHIRRLEEQLGVELFRRLPRGMALTEAGTSLVPAARRILREIDSVIDLFSDPLTGQISIGLPEEYSGLVFEEVLRAFGDRHRDVEVRATCGCSHKFPEQIEGGQLDIAIYAAPPSAASDAFFAEPMVWVSDESFALTAAAPVPLAILDRSCWWSAVPTETLAAADRSWKVAYKSESYDGVKAAIGAGLAIGMLPLSAVGGNMIARSDLPALPPASLVLLRDNTGSRPVLDVMEHAILSAFGRTA